MNQSLSILIGLALVLGIGGLVFWQTSTEDAALPIIDAGSRTVDAQDSSKMGDDTIPEQEVEIEDDENDSAVSGASGKGASGTSLPIAATTVAEHNSASSCWSIINGNVYDLTSWIPKHPGGPQAILQLCGKDGSAKFNAQHGGQATQAQVLAGFKIGTTR